MTIGNRKTLENTESSKALNKVGETVALTYWVGGPVVLRACGFPGLLTLFRLIGKICVAHKQPRHSLSMPVKSNEKRGKLFSQRNHVYH